MLNQDELALAATLTQAIARDDHDAVADLRDQLRRKDSPTVYDYLLMQKAAKFLRLHVEADLAEHLIILEGIRSRCSAAARPISDIRSEKSAVDPSLLDEQRANVILQSIRSICILASTRTSLRWTSLFGRKRWTF